MKKILMLLALLCAMQTAFSSNSQQVIVTGEIINTTSITPKVVKANFFNPLKQNGLSLKLDNGYQFKFIEEMLFAQNMNVNYDNYFIILFVKPGDSVHLTIDASLLAKKDLSWLKISGDHALISLQLNQVHTFLRQIPYHKYNYSATPSTMLLEVKKDLDRYLTALKTYTELHQLDPKVVEVEAADWKYGLANYISDYEHDDAAKVLFGDIFFDRNNDKNFQSQMYPYYLADYANRITKADSSTVLAIKEQRILDAIKSGVQLLLKEPAGASRDYMIYKYINNFQSKNPNILDSISNVKLLFNESLYYDHLKEAEGLLQRTIFPTTKISGLIYSTTKRKISTINETDVFQYLKKRYPNKVLYIDVFATWCAPCKEEHQKTPTLHQNFKGKDVVFVNLCLLSTVNNWRNMIKEGSIEGENYYMNDDDSKLFMGTYQLAGFPSYILMGKDGKIITTRAPRPSEITATTKIINQAL